MTTIEALVAQLPGIGLLRRDPVLYAAVNGTHILGLGVLIGSMVHVDLRILGLWRGDAWLAGLRNVMPVARIAFLLVIATGYLLFMNRPGHYLANPAFQIKMALLALAVLNILVFDHLLWRGAETRSAAMRISAALSLVLWIGVLFAGRAIGFV